MYYNLKDLVLQQLPVTEKVNETEKLKKTTSVYIPKLIKIDGKFIHLYGGASYGEVFKTSSFGKVIEELFTLRKRQKEEKLVMQRLEKVLINSLFGDNLRKNIEDKFAFNQNFG